MTRAFLQTKTGEVEGGFSVVDNGSGVFWWDFISPLVSMDSAVMDSEAAALAHFEEHFGRIEIKESE